MEDIGVGEPLRSVADGREPPVPTFVAEPVAESRVVPSAIEFDHEPGFTVEGVDPPDEARDRRGAPPGARRAGDLPDRRSSGTGLPGPTPDGPGHAEPRRGPGASRPRRDPGGPRCPASHRCPRCSGFGWPKRHRAPAPPWPSVAAMPDRAAPSLVGRSEARPPWSSARGGWSSSSGVSAFDHGRRVRVRPMVSRAGSRANPGNPQSAAADSWLMNARGSSSNTAVIRTWCGVWGLLAARSVRRPDLAQCELVSRWSMADRLAPSWRI